MRTTLKRKGVDPRLLPVWITGSVSKKKQLTDHNLDINFGQLLTDQICVYSTVRRDAKCLIRRLTLKTAFLTG